MSIKSLISDWHAFVEGVLNGYEFDISEYENDLALRDHIENEVQKETIIDQSFKAALDNSDTRLREILIPLSRPLKIMPATPWWYMGIPANALEVVNDARELGLLDF